MQTAIILSIGDELVLGQTVDTNSAWLSQQLAAVGCAIKAHMTVPDDQRAIEDAIRESAQRCDFLIVTGGIGPTADDLTRQALAGVMKAPLELDQKWLDHMAAYFKERGRVMPKTNEIQATIPRGTQLIWNHNGTAAGIRTTVSTTIPAAEQTSSPDSLEGRPLGRVLTKLGKVNREQVVEALAFQKEKGGMIGNILVGLGHCRLTDVEEALNAQRGEARSDRVQQCEVFVTPGVPKEMKMMFERDVLPRIKGGASDSVILSRTLHTFALGESAIAELLGDLMKRDRNPSVGTTVANGIVSLRINSRFDSRDEAMKQLEETDRACRDKLGDLIFGADDETLQQIVGQLLTSSRKKVTTAESCTGGLLAKMITDVPGSSDYFHAGFITYSNKAKYERLGVSMEIINVYGAVSEPVVSAMARNARRLTKSHFAVAISGVAGPTGGSVAKPVGTVCIALAFHDEQPPVTRTFLFPGDREWVRDRAAKMALTMLRYHLLEKPLPV
jgi:competence/damage-inducible protein CinA-like protein/molybdenum cofactor synthesis domain-containing protein